MGRPFSPHAPIAGIYKWDTSSLSSIHLCKGIPSSNALTPSRCSFFFQAASAALAITIISRRKVTDSTCKKLTRRHCCVSFLACLVDFSQTTVVEKKLHQWFSCLSYDFAGFQSSFRQCKIGFFAAALWSWKTPLFQADTCRESGWCWKVKKKPLKCWNVVTEHGIWYPSNHRPCSIVIPQVSKESDPVPSWEYKGLTTKHSKSPEFSCPCRALWRQS